MRAILLFGVILGIAPAFTQDEKPKVLAARLLPGEGVTDPMDKVGYFPNTTGGVDALDLATGKLLWSSKDGNRPLLATDTRLFVQAGKTNSVRVYVLDTTEKGKRVLESQPIKFPSWVSVEIAYGRRYSSHSLLDGKSLRMVWNANAFYSGGAAPPPKIQEAERKNASGIAKVDLEIGTVEALPTEKSSTEPLPRLVSKVGMLTLSVKDEPTKNPIKPFERRRTLQAVNDAKEVVWRHEIAAPIFLVPRP